MIYFLITTLIMLRDLILQGVGKFCGGVKVCSELFICRLKAGLRGIAHRVFAVRGRALNIKLHRGCVLSYAALLSVLCSAPEASGNGNGAPVAGAKQPDSAEARPNGGGEALNYTLDDFRNYFGGSWGGSPNEVLTYCKNMNIRHIMYVSGMENNRLADGCWFYFESPEYMTYNRIIDFDKVAEGKYSQSDIDKWQRDCALLDASKPFPKNLATGWFFNTPKRSWKVCSLILDFQQKRVVDNAIKVITARAKNVVDTAKKNSIGLKFGGYIWDVPQPTGDFYGFVNGSKYAKQVELKDLRGVDSADVLPGNVHDFPTFSEGMLYYYSKLRSESKKINPDVKFIIDPAYLWEHWQEHIDRRSDLDKFPGALPDLITEEFHTTNFVDDARVFKSGLVKKDMVATSTFHCWYDTDVEILLIGAAAKEGAWSTFFGHTGPGCKSIADIPARMKISRFIATWENLNNTPLSKREFDRKNLVYSSPTAQMTLDAFGAMKPQTSDFFFCMVSPKGKIKIPDGYKISKIKALDPLFNKIRSPLKSRRNGDGSRTYCLNEKWGLQSRLFNLKDGYLEPASDAVLNEAFVMELKKLK